MSACIDTPEGIAFARLCALKGALRLELVGIRMSRGRTAYSLLKDMGFRGSRQKVLDAVIAEVERILDPSESGFSEYRLMPNA